MRVKDLTKQQAKLHPYHSVGCFNDMDMLVVGMYGKGNVGLSGCNDVQYRTHYSIWALFGSPLMIGCDIRNMNEETKKILENKELIAINQDPLCRQPIRLDGIWSGDDVLIYSRQLSNGDLAIGFFNLKDESVVANLNLDEVGLPMSTGKTLQMKEVWTGEDLPSLNGTVRPWSLMVVQSTAARSLICNGHLHEMRKGADPAGSGSLSEICQPGQYIVSV
jgi:alpha-galactosidase